MGVVAHQYVGASMYQLMGFPSLPGDGFQGMFATPVEGDDNDSGGIGCPQAVYTFQQ